MKRELTKDERSAVERALPTYETELERFRFVQRELQHQLDIIDERKRYELIDEKNAYNAKLKEVLNHIKETEFSITTIKDQLKNGVEVKKDESKK